MAMINPNGIVDGNSQNIPEANVPRTRSTFPLKYHFFNTHRFGELTPHYVEDCVKGDKLPVQSRHDIRSYTLAAPLMQNVKRNKDYFLVPMECILPRNWEKFFDNPVRGDDVLDDVGPSVDEFWTKVDHIATNLWFTFKGQLANGIITDDKALEAAFRLLITLEYFYSDGSLLSSLGCSGSTYFDAQDNNTGDRYCFDELFDFFINKIVIKYVERFELHVDGYDYGVVPVLPKHFVTRSAISLRHALSLMRDNLVFTISNYANTSDLPAGSSLKAEIASFFSDYFDDIHSGAFPQDLSRLWAYQLCCAHYMSNDHIDFVYSAELYRQLIGYYVGHFYFNNQFARNGIDYEYDYLSGHFFDEAINMLRNNNGAEYVNYLFGDYSDPSDLLVVQFVAPYFSALFGYRRSLRYLDYFTGIRSQPLAVVTNGINTNVSVNNNAVSVIDITKSIQAQRFLNAVNRVRHNFEGYLKGIFGGEMPAPDYHNPFYIAHTDDVIFGQETENTGAAQVDPDTPIAITTNLRGNSGNYIFNVECDRPCIVIGITSYDITRVYSHSIERAFFKSNRFDYFNPFMQYVGDQPVYYQELGLTPIAASQLGLLNFGYSLRHMEYKQRYSQCSGGFVEYLPNWLFTALDNRGNQYTINPDWIRALPAEFDRFYKVLSGYSLATYFHFIVDDYNSCNASRPMAYAPNIL